MMGINESQKELFSYSVDLDQRVRAENPLRGVKEQIDFTFVRQEVRGCYGYNGNESVDPAVIMKMMFLLFYDNVASERELMRIIRERLDYMWFLGYELDDETPDHSVLSKARNRWGVEVFEKLFVNIVGQCVEKGLVGGEKVHVDGSLINANASKNSVLKGCPELIKALKDVYREQNSKLEDPEDRPKPLGTPYYEAENNSLISTTDPDSTITRQNALGARPRYKAHRVVDDKHGVITATETTPGDVEENRKLMDMVGQHEQNTATTVKTVVADTQYGTADNFRSCNQRGITSHMGDMLGRQLKKGRRDGIFGYEDFKYDAPTDTYTCPAGETLTKRKCKSKRNAYEYACSMTICKACKIRAQCTRAKCGNARTIMRHDKQEAIDEARKQSHSNEARQDRVRRKWMMEGSFADAANNHGFKRARWRRLWRQRIQDYMIAAVQNVRILLRNMKKPLLVAMQEETRLISGIISNVFVCIGQIWREFRMQLHKTPRVNRWIIELCWSR
jgi:transposase